MKLSSYATPYKKEILNNTICLIFSGREGTSIQLAPEIYQSLINSKWEEIDPGILIKLKELKIIVPDEENELDEINKENQLFVENQQQNLLYFVFQTSANCQLGCDYCGQFHEKVNMSEPTIHKLIERVKSKYKPNHTKIKIAWFGGEPLLALKEMRLINEEIKTFAYEKNVIYESKITTNGVALTLDIYKELIQDFNLNQIDITLDGTAEFHDKRRQTKGNKPSYEVIFKHVVEIANHSKESEDMCAINVRCNVDQRNFKAVFPLLKTLTEYGLQNKVLFYVAHIRSWGQNKANKDLSMEEFANHQIDYFLEMRKLGFHVPNVLPGRVKMTNCVGTSSENEMFDAYGNIFDCSETSYTPVYKNTPFDLGHINKIGNKDLQQRPLLSFNSDVRNGVYSRCVNCKFYPQCGGGCPKAQYENDPICPYFIHNLVDLMYLDFLFRKKSYIQL